MFTIPRIVGLDKLETGWGSAAVWGPWGEGNEGHVPTHSSVFHVFTVRR